MNRIRALSFVAVFLSIGIGITSCGDAPLAPLAADDGEIVEKLGQVRMARSIVTAVDFQRFGVHRLSLIERCSNALAA